MKEQYHEMNKSKNMGGNDSRKPEYTERLIQVAVKGTEDN